MSLEKLKELGDAIAGLRAAVETGAASTTQEREAQAKRLTELESRLAAAEQTMRSRTLSLPGSEELRGKWSGPRAIRALLTGDWDKAPVERDVHKEMVKRLTEEQLRHLLPEQRATLTTVPSAAGLLVPEELSSVVIERPAFQAVTKGLGLTQVRPSGFPFKVNKRTTGLTAYMVGENVASTASDIAVGQVSLNPRKCVARTYVTAEQIAFGNPQTDQTIMDEITLAIALKQDDMVLNGIGASGEPIGVFNTTGISTTAATVSGKFKWADIAIAMGKIQSAMKGRPMVNTGVACHSDLVWELARDVVDQYAAQGEAANAAYVLGVPFLSPERFKQICGANLGISNQIATTKAMTADWRYGWLAEFGGMVIAKSDIATDGTNNAWTQEGVHIKATTWFDFAVVLAEAFAATTGA